MLLLVEAGLCTILILPAPAFVKKLVARTFESLLAVSSVKIAVVCTITIVSFLFVSSILEYLRTKGDTHEDFDIRLRARRNSYLTGFTVFLMFALWRFQSILTKETKLLEEVSALRKKDEAKRYALQKQKANQETAVKSMVEETERLKKKLKDFTEKIEAAKKEVEEVEALKKKAEETQKAYMELLDNQ